MGKGGVLGNYATVISSEPKGAQHKPFMIWDFCFVGGFFGLVYDWGIGWICLFLKITTYLPAGDQIVSRSF